MTVAQLAAAIRAAIYTNDSGNINGDQLQTVLIDIIQSFLNTGDLPLSGANGGTGVANTGRTITLGGNITTAGAITTAGTLNQAGAFTLTLTVAANSTPTFPNGTGTLAYKDDANTWADAQTVAANLTVNNGGAFSCVGAVTIGTTTLAGDLNVNDTRNFVFNTGTGTKIATNSNQKIGFWNATPVIRPTTAIVAAAFAANSSNISDDSATFGGYTMGQVVAALKVIGLLA